MKVGKNNFKPPPAVESSVVRIVPKNPRPQISYDEWDGLLRIVFVRKNKTIRASFFGTTCIMDLLEYNYRSWCAQNDISLELDPAEPDQNDEMVIEENELEDMDEAWNGITHTDDEEIPEFFKEATDPQERLQNERKSKRRRKGKVVELVREKVRKVIEEETDLADKRARNCKESDFLRLLWGFNQEGIHFT